MNHMAGPFAKAIFEFDLLPLPSPTPTLALGRYLLFDEIASGGMASVHFGLLSGPGGFSRVVAIKRLHPNFAKDPEFVTMFLDEARLAARIRHPNVVPTLDVVAIAREIFLVMDYVHGQSLSRLWRSARTLNRPADPRIVATVMSGVLQGLHAAHDARGERGEPLEIVHRDVSPQNILVGVDGVARLLDFGVAKAAGRVQMTREGHIKGKIAYMPPEQLHGAAVTRQTDVYAAAVVTWEMLTGKRAFSGRHEGAVVSAILAEPLPPAQQGRSPHAARLRRRRNARTASQSGATPFLGARDGAGAGALRGDRLVGGGRRLGASECARGPHAPRAPHRGDRRGHPLGRTARSLEARAQ